MDFNRLVTQIKGDENYLRVRQGTVAAVNSDYTINVTIAGDTNVLPKVKYLGHYAPRTNTQVWILTDGTDMIALGHLAPRSAPLIRVNKNAVQTTTTAVEAAVTWATEVGTDVWGMWSTGANVSAPIAGYYTATFWGNFVANTTGVREATIQTSTDAGSTWTVGARFRTNALSAGVSDLMVSLPATSLSAGNLLRVTVTQTSGGNLDLNADARFSVQYAGPVE